MIIQRPLFLCLAILAVFPFCPSASPAGVDPIGWGPHPVGSSYFESEADPETLEPYLRGGRADGGSLYVDSILETPGAAFTVRVNVPLNPLLYGSRAGATMTYTSIILYPTTEDNTRPDHLFAGNEVYVISRMQGETDVPLFAEPDGRYPMIVYSHGRGQHPLQELPVLEQLASHGYIVVAPFHGDLRLRSVDIVAEAALRPLSVKRIIDALKENPQFGGNIDFDQIGGVGASLGGTTMMALMGGRPLDLSGTATDSRVRAAVGIVPFFGTSLLPVFGSGGSGVEKVTNPIMSIVALQDTIASPAVAREVTEATAGTQYLIALPDEEHAVSVNAIPDVLTWTILFLNAYVKKDEPSRELLKAASFVRGGVTDLKILQKIVPEQPVIQSFAGWISAKELPPELSGPSDEPAGDGVPNLLKFALGLDPMVPSADQLPVLSLAAEESGVFPVLEFTRSLPVEGIELKLESSPDLVNWTSVPLEIEVVEVVDDQVERVRMVANEPLGNEYRLFFRLVVERLEEQPTSFGGSGDGG